MNFIKTEDVEIVKNLISGIRSKRLLFNNYFGIDNLSNSEYISTPNTLLIRQPVNGFNRIYVMSDNALDFGKVLINVQYGDTINIPSRNGINDWIDLLDDAHFTKIGTYRRYYNMNIPRIGKSALDYAIERDFHSIYNILYSKFSSITDRLPNCVEIKKMIASNQIIVNRDDAGKVSGLLIFTFEKNKCYLNAWIDVGGNGLSLLFKIYGLVKERGIKYVYFWVNEDNTEVVKIHEALGAKFDGLIDYTFEKQ